MKTFKDLKVWQKAHSLALNVYKTTNSFSEEERFSLVSQIRRSATSVPTNIVESFKRKSNKDYAHFLNLADSSLEETKYHLILALDLGYISSSNFEKPNEQCGETGRMLSGLQKKLNT